jgi:hypothetical protein
MVLDDTGVILVVKPDNTEKYVVWQEMIGERKPQLELLQHHVGGRHIKLVKIFYKGVDRDAYINEQGHLRNLPENARGSQICGFDIVGPLVILL